MSDQESERMFDQLLVLMTGLGTEESASPVAVFDSAGMPEDPEPDPYPTQEAEREIAPAQDMVCELPEPETQESYKGFLYIRCEHCGQVHGYCAKELMTFHKCPDCSGKTKLKNLTHLYVNCECGKKWKYRTNMTDFAFDVNCVQCGTPVAVKWNKRAEQYETME